MRQSKGARRQTLICGANRRSHPLSCEINTKVCRLIRLNGYYISIYKLATMLRTISSLVPCCFSFPSLSLWSQSCLTRFYSTYYFIPESSLCNLFLKNYYVLIKIYYEKRVFVTQQLPTQVSRGSSRAENRIARSLVIIGKDKSRFM